MLKWFISIAFDPVANAINIIIFLLSPQFSLIKFRNLWTSHIEVCLGCEGLHWKHRALV